MLEELDTNNCRKQGDCLNKKRISIKKQNIFKKEPNRNSLTEKYSS